MYILFYYRCSSLVSTYCYDLQVTRGTFFFFLVGKGREMRHAPQRLGPVCGTPTGLASGPECPFGRYALLSYPLKTPLCRWSRLHPAK
jgi:hypothetical protein